MSTDLELLMARYFDGTACDEEIRALNEVLRGDAEARRQMLLAAGRESALREVFGVEVPGSQVVPGSGAFARREFVGRRSSERLVSNTRLVARTHSRRLKSPRNLQSSRAVLFPVLAAAALLLGVTCFILLASGGSVNNVQSAQPPLGAAPKGPVPTDTGGAVRDRTRREHEVERLKLERKAVLERLAWIEREAERVKAGQATAAQNEREQLQNAEALQQLEACRKVEETKLAEVHYAEKQAEQDLARPMPPRQAIAESAELGRVVFVAAAGEASARPERVRGRGQKILREPLTRGMAVQVGDRIETGVPVTGQTIRPVRAALEMNGGAMVDLADGTSFEVLSASALALAEGRVYAELPELSSSTGSAVGGLTVKTVFSDVELGFCSVDLACDHSEAVLQVEVGTSSLSNAHGRRVLKTLQKSVVRKDCAPVPAVSISMSALWRGRKGPAGTPTPKAKPPQPPLDGLKAWFKADAGIAADERRGVSAWQDASGNVLTQSQAAAQPQWVEQAFNGKPALRFDGKDDVLTSSLVPASGAKARTIFVVVGNLPPRAGRGFVVHYGSQRNYETYGLFLDTGALGNDYWCSTHAGAFDRKINAGPTVLCASYNGKEDRLWANGKDLGAKAITLKTGSGQGLRIGSKIVDGQNPFQGDVAEVLAYERALSDTERMQVEQYLSAKYGR